jgi:transcriptional regulator with XRE-family HTH domain
MGETPEDQRRAALQAIGARIRTLREAQGLTQRDLAAAMVPPVKQSVISRLEGGTHPSMVQPLRIAEALGVPPHLLFGSNAVLDALAALLPTMAQMMRLFGQLTAVQQERLVAFVRTLVTLPPEATDLPEGGTPPLQRPPVPDTTPPGHSDVPGSQ